MKAFVVICSCAEEHDEKNKRCPVEQVMFVLQAHNLENVIHDVLDIQPVFDHEDVVP